MSGLNPSLGANLKTAAVGTIGGGFAGYNMYALGYLGDYLDVTNHRVVSKKKFLKQYQIQGNAQLVIFVCWQIGFKTKQKNLKFLNTWNLRFFSRILESS